MLNGEHEQNVSYCIGEVELKLEISPISILYLNNGVN